MRLSNFFCLFQKLFPVSSHFFPIISFMVTVSPLKRALTVDTKEPRPIFSSFTSSRPDVFCRKGVLRNFANFTGKHLCQSIFSNKETLVQVFSCKFCEISKNTSSYRTSPVAASVNHTTVLLKCDSCLCQHLFLAFSSLYEKTD